MGLVHYVFERLVESLIALALYIKNRLGCFACIVGHAGEESLYREGVLQCEAGFYILRFACAQGNHILFL